MARILIVEPSADVRELFAHVVVRLGHEPVALDRPCPRDETSDVALVLLEPDAPGALAFAQALHADRPELPIVCASIQPRSPEAAAFAPAAYLLKPFALAELEAALSGALRAVESARTLRPAPRAA